MADTKLPSRSFDRRVLLSIMACAPDETQPLASLFAP